MSEISDLSETEFDAPKNYQVETNSPDFCPKEESDVYKSSHPNEITQIYVAEKSEQKYDFKFSKF